MSDVATSMLSVSDYTWARLRDRLEGLDDAEYFWEPVSGAWSLRQGAGGEWYLDGDGGGGPAPDPAPVTTIAWRVGHLGGLALGGFTARRFPEMAREEPLPTSGSAVVPFLERAYQQWRGGIESLQADDWHRRLGPDWGPYADDTTLDLVLHVLDEMIHHGAEIALMRDYYFHRNVWTGSDEQTR